VQQPRHRRGNEIWYRREVLKRVRQNAQRRLCELARAKDLKKIAKHKQRYVNLVAAIKPPSVIKDASRKELRAMIAEVKRKVPGFLPADY
jgi:hypothetical protein